MRLEGSRKTVAKFADPSHRVIRMNYRNISQGQRVCANDLDGDTRVLRQGPSSLLSCCCDPRWSIEQTMDAAGSTRGRKRSPRHQRQTAAKLPLIETLAPGNRRTDGWTDIQTIVSEISRLRLQLVASVRSVDSSRTNAADHMKRKDG